jgi:hypothetical protein
MIVLFKGLRLLRFGKSCKWVMTRSPADGKGKQLSYPNIPHHLNNCKEMSHRMGHDPQNSAIYTSCGAFALELPVV